MSAPHLVCFHCGLPVPANAAIHASIDGVARPMCCSGCAAVAALIDGSGLGEYYRHRTSLPSRPETATATVAEYAVFDAADAQQDFVVSSDDGRCRAELAVDGINCAACAWLIERHLGSLAEIEQASVNLGEHRLSVSWHPDRLRLSQIMSAIRRLGYRPRPFLPLPQMQALREENRRALRRLGLAGIVQMHIGMFAIGLYIGAFDGIAVLQRDMLRWASLVLCVPVVMYSASPFFAGAWRGLRNARPGMDLPVALAIGLAFLASAWATVRGAPAVYFDSVAMFCFFLLLARYVEMRSRQHAALASLAALSLIPSAATRFIDAGERTELIPVNRLRPGDRVLVRAGEAFAVDGVVVNGHSSVDESSLSGESLPVAKQIGDAVSAGTLNIDGVLTVTVQATGLASRIGSIMTLVDRAQREKPVFAQLADRIAGWFVVGVLLIAALAGIYWNLRDSSRTLEILLSVLVVSCPCALSLATPAAFTAATTALKRRGLLITRGHALDALANIDSVFFDKTGTLTNSAITLEEVVPLDGANRENCLQLAASIESRSRHPIAAAFTGVTATTLPLDDFREVPGGGIVARIADMEYRVGTAAFVLEPGTVLQAPTPGKWILLASTQRPLAWFRLGERLRDDAEVVMRSLTGMQLRTTVISGDTEAAVRHAAEQLQMDEWLADCTPERKLAMIRAAQAKGHRILMVGDGINDVPVLAGADVSIAMCDASDLARTNADCLLLRGELGLVPETIRMARRTRRVIRQNIAWAVLYNLTAIPFAVAGFVPPWLAAIGMSASSLLVVANALRLR